MKIAVLFSQAMRIIVSAYDETVYVTKAFTILMQHLAM